jgi:hypothetical protein
MSDYLVVMCADALKQLEHPLGAASCGLMLAHALQWHGAWESLADILAAAYAESGA